MSRVMIRFPNWGQKTLEFLSYYGCSANLLVVYLCKTEGTTAVGVSCRFWWLMVEFGCM